jgi:hypothetical protein
MGSDDLIAAGNVDPVDRTLGQNLTLAVARQYRNFW